MSNRVIFRGLTLFLLVPVLAGCTATFQTTPIQPLERASALHVHVASVESNVDCDVSRETADLEVELVERFRAMAGVSQVSLGDLTAETEDVVIVRVSVSAVRKVGRAKRFFLGEMAGRASMTAEVEFVDGRSGIVLGRYEVVGKSRNARYSGVTDDAVVKTAEAVLAVMEEGYSWMPRVPISRETGQ